MSDENDTIGVSGRPKATVTRLPSARLSVQEAIEEVQKAVPGDAETFLALWYAKDGQIRYVAVGRNGELLWLAQTMAVCLPLGISGETGFDEDDD